MSNIYLYIYIVIYIYIYLSQNKINICNKYILQYSPYQAAPGAQPRARGARGAAAVVRFKQWTPAQ